LSNGKYIYKGEKSQKKQTDTIQNEHKKYSSQPNMEKKRVMIYEQPLVTTFKTTSISSISIGQK